MNKNFTLVIILALLILGFFYWYEYRPSKIKEMCSADARFDNRAISEPDNNKRQEFINNYYSDCLIRFGLK